MVESLENRSYNEVEKLFFDGVVTEDAWREYQEAWALHGRWHRGIYCYTHISEFADNLRVQIVHQKQTAFPWHAD